MVWSPDLSGLRTVDFLGLECALLDDLRAAVGFQAAKEATAVAFVADAGADRLDADEQGIGVAVDADVAHFQDVTAGFAFFPEAVARAAEEDDFAGALRFGAAMRRS